ncbi:MAG: serine hydrolase [Candidatus Aminicenantes bacterium]|nr:serine hydrolase [Candidatus Aminicenantes bacterium]MDH5705785.1 serine hydrolase [Candidatus Aminicenantes bacterium]
MKNDVLGFDFRQKRIFPFFAFFVSILTLFLTLYCSTARTDLEARIQRIENGLIPEPGIVLQGKLPQKAGLLDRMSAYKIPGVSIAVINDHRIEWARGYGVKEDEGNDPVTVRTLFQAASISKPVAALAALCYVEKGLLDLDDDVNGKLRSWHVPDNEFTQSKKVTLRGMMSHNAGLTVHGFRGYAQGEEIPSLRQVLDGEKPANSKAIRVDKEPGAGFRYSGGGYTVMQQLLIDLKGKPFPDIMRETVLDKLKMADSTYEQPLPESLAARAATAHRMNGKAIKGKWHTYPEMAAAGLWTTPTDLCRFAIEVMESRKDRSQRVLSQKMVRQMLTEQAEGMGLGLFLWDEGEDFRIMHGGSNEGFRCALVAYPEKGQGAAIMVNSDYGGSLMSELLRSLSAEYGWKHFRPVEKDAAKINLDIYDEYAGTYQVTPRRKIEITREGDRLFAEPVFVIPSGESRCEIFPESETVFFLTETSQKITFTRDEKGKVIGLILEDRGRKMKASRLD